MRITQGTQRNAQELAIIASETFLHTYCAINPENREILSAYCRANFYEEKISQEMGRNGVAFYMMKEDDALIGYAKTVKDLEKKLEIEKLYIIESTQGQGLGLKFMEHILAQAKHEGIKKIWLNVYDQNTGAIKFYERFGFKKVGERAFKYSWNGIDYQDNDWVMEYDVVSDKELAQSKKASSKQSLK
jgi:ribosomal protein S18 acetylase RimI-like enzyme